MSTFSNKAVVVTGGNSGMGLATVVFLASEDASYITGVELNVDGGMGQR